MRRIKIRSGKTGKTEILTAAVISTVYLSWWFKFSNADNMFLYGLLFFGEIYHILMLYVFLWTAWPGKSLKMGIQKTQNFYPSVDIFIPVAGEPADIVEKTIQAAKKIVYPNFNIYVLNDGYVAEKENWRDIEHLAQNLGVGCITRRNPGGAKAGNINNALKSTSGEIIVIFDADMVAYPDFLDKTIFYFNDPKIGFVQTPQYYKNWRVNEVAQAAWDQQEFFYGPIMIGKEKSNASFICGTNVAIRRSALESVGGMNELTITEDVLTSLHIHQKGWKSVYVSEVLTEGLAPEDLLSYYKQQLRWARGALDLFFHHNPLFARNLSLTQRIEYFSSALYYLSGTIVLIDMIMPLIYLSSGLQPVKAETTVFAFYFLPYIFLTVYIMYRASDASLTFRAFSFSFSSFALQLKALFSILTGQKMGFSVTPKKAQTGNFSFLARPHVGYLILFILAIGAGIYREGITPAVTTNIAWGMFNVAMLLPFIRIAFTPNNPDANQEPITDNRDKLIADRHSVLGIGAESI